MDILKKTLELNIDERIDYWLELAEKLENKEDYPCPIEEVDSVYLKNGVTSKKLYGFYEDGDLEFFFMSYGINVISKESNFCILAYNDSNYKIETVDLINRHGDDLGDETVFQLHTLVAI